MNSGILLTDLGDEVAYRRDELTSREAEVLRRLARGQCNKLIARDLGIADATVKVHVKSLLRKLRVLNRTQAAVWAVSNGFAGLPMRPSDAPVAAAA
jgi:two-component system, NarL family, nitrate/nitrite response regulator NarL